MSLSSVPSPASSASWVERVDVFRRRRRLMLLAALAVVAIYVPFVAAMPNLYRASAKVLVEGRSGSGVGSGAPGEVDSRLQEIKQLAFSRAELTRLVDTYRLYAVPSATPMEARADRLQRDLKIDVIGNDATGGRPTAVAFQISYVGTDRDTVAAVANALAAFYVAQNDRLKAGVATQASALLAQQVADAKRRLADQDDRLRGYAATNKGALPQQTEANIAALQRLNAQLQLVDQAQMRLVERRQTLQSQLADLETRQPPPPPPPDTNDLPARLALLERQLADLKTKWTDRAPDVQVVQDQIAALKQQIAATTSPRPAAPAAPQASPRVTLAAALAETSGQLDRLAKESEGLRGEIAALEARVDTAPLHGQQLQMLTRDEQVSRDIYESALKRYNDASLTERAQVGNTEEFRILDAAIPPQGPAAPNRALLLILGLALSLVTAVGAVLLAEHLDTSFHSLDQLRAFTRVPVLVSIPEIATPADRFALHLRAAAWAGVSAATMTLLALVSFHVGRSAEPLVRILVQSGVK